MRQLLHDYGGWLDSSPHPYLLMACLHRGGGDFDFWTRGEDTFELSGVPEMNNAEFGNFIAGFAAGHMHDDTAYVLVRAAGAFYGDAAALIPGGTDEFGPLEYLGDSEDSVTFINVGYTFGSSSK